MKQEPTTHPDFGELEAYRRGEADQATIEHVAACAQCRLDLEEIQGLADLVRDDAAALPAVPDAFDKQLLWNARQSAARVRRQRARSTVQRWAIAASLLLSVAAVAVWRQMNRGSAPAPQAKLDIVDALTLARRLAAAQSALRQAQGERPGDARYDVNHDGRVDAADVERIARQAVALGDV